MEEKYGFPRKIVEFIGSYAAFFGPLLTLVIVLVLMGGYSIDDDFEAAVRKALEDGGTEGLVGMRNELVQQVGMKLFGVREGNITEIVGLQGFDETYEAFQLKIGEGENVQVLDMDANTTLAGVRSFVKSLGEGYSLIEMPEAGSNYNVLVAMSETGIRPLAGFGFSDEGKLSQFNGVNSIHWGIDGNAIVQPDMP
ncbi:hypothetical protein KC640_03575 [Candidatus Dojkabacteria bacterium]|uniref:Uncharacterized protein n=1 Tax=Candidatus Dojkabacteria bacterium TaxID=2099670 RepID=A0A955IDE2_9BACT|nr:hypothetical protein [Candidatus Dojkabacteria bacterium]